MKIVINGVTYVPEVKAEEPRKARLFWIDTNLSFPTLFGVAFAHYTTNDGSGATVIPVREILPDEVVIAKDKIFAAWNNIRGAYGPHDFVRFCRALGLEDKK